MSALKARRFRGERLKALRRDRGLSQTQLGSRIGAHVTSVSDWERGANAPSGRHVASLARELGVAAEHFYDEDDDEESDPVTGIYAGLLWMVREAVRDELRKKVTA